MPTWKVMGLLALATAAAVTGLSVPQTADASGFYLPGRGVKPMGRGGAYVAAGGGNLNSIWYNPANLSLLEGTELVVDTSLVTTQSKFQRAPRTRRNGESETYNPVKNQAGPHPIPQVLVGGDTGADGLAWAAGLWAPYGSHITFPEDGAQRYSLIDNSKSVFAFLGIAVAYQFNDSFRIGAGFQNMIADIKIINKTSAYTGLFGRPEDHDLDIFTQITDKDFFAPTGNVGVWFEPVDHFQIASSVQLPSKVHDKDAEMKVRFPSHPAFDNAELSNNTVSGTITFPLILRAALRYSANRFDVELAGVFEGWSVFEEIPVNPNDIDVENVPGLGGVPIGPLSVPQNWKDSFSVRLGSHYDFSESFSLRAGYIFETGAVPPEYYSVFSPDPDKHVFSAGFTYDFGDIEIDTSAAFYALNNREVTSSQLRQINPIDTEDELATIVGNGTYQTSHFIAGTGINWTF